VLDKANGAADKPRRAESRRLSRPEVGLIRVVVRRFAPRKQRMLSAAPLSRARSVRDNKRLIAVSAAHALSLRRQPTPFASTTVLAGTLIAAASPLAGAAEPTFVLDAVTVLGTGLETPLLESPASVTVIDQETIAETPPSSVAELLRDVPGVEISSAGVPGVERIRIRGEESRRVIIQIDGQPLTDESGFGQPILVDPTTVERIEVVRGASSVVSGARAIGGVVNIITKRGGKRPIEGSATGSYFSATSGYRAAASVAGATGGFDYRLSAGRSEQGDQRTPDGRLEPSDFGDSSLSGHLGYAWGNHYLSMKAQQYKLAANGYTGDPNFTLELPARDLRKIGMFYDGNLEGLRRRSGLRGRRGARKKQQRRPELQRRRSRPRFARPGLYAVRRLVVARQPVAGLHLPDVGAAFSVDDGQLTVGNPDLDPETSVTFEIGGRYGANGGVLDAAIFYSRAKDFIDRQQTSAPPAGSYFNLDRATTYGFEIFANTQIGKTGWSPYTISL